MMQVVKNNFHILSYKKSNFLYILKKFVKLVLKYSRFNCDKNSSKKAYFFLLKLKYFLIKSESSTKLLKCILEGLESGDLLRSI